MYLISVYFDQRTTKILQKYIDRIAQETGNAFMTQNHVPPHMTISAVEARNVEVLVPAVDALQGKLKCGLVQFVSVGQLLPYVCYATPVLNRYLQESFSPFEGQVTELGLAKVNPHEDVVRFALASEE